MSSKTLVAAITPENVSPGTIMFANPSQTAADALAKDITPKLINDIYESLPAGAVTKASVTTLMDDTKTLLLTGKPPSGFFGLLENVFSSVITSTAAPSSAAAGTQLAHLITGAMVKDIITLASPFIPPAEIKSAVSLLKTDLTTGKGIEPWLKTELTAFGAIGPIPHQF